MFRGFGAVVEGAEFLLTHRHLWRPLAAHFMVSVVLVVAADVAVDPLQSIVAPSVPALSFPWYLVLVEWSWGAMPAFLASLIAYLLAEAAYLGLAWPAPLVRRVLAVRGPVDLGPEHGPDRLLVAAGVAAGSALCGGALLIPQLGIPVAIALGLVTLGTGVLDPPLRVRLGWSGRPVNALRKRPGYCVGLGAGLLVLFAIPILHLAAFPIAVAGATCLIARDERGTPPRGV